MDILKRLIFWDFVRGSWQYDIICVLILSFIFLTPRSFFRDQPRPENIALIPSESGTSQYWIEPDRLTAGDTANRERQALTLVRQQPSGRDRTLVRLETIYDSEKEIRGYLAITRP